MFDRKKEKFTNPMARYLLFLIFLIGAANTCLPQQAKSSTDLPSPAVIERDEKVWQEFLSSSGGFAILMPGKPTERIDYLNTSIGRLKISDYSLKTSTAEYLVRYLDFPDEAAALLKDPKNAQEMFDSGRDNALKSYNGKLINEENIFLDGHPGRRFKMEVPGGIIVHSKLFVVGRRNYQIYIVTTNSSAITVENAKLRERVIARFLDSFRLLGGEGSTR